MFEKTESGGLVHSLEQMISIAKIKLQIANAGCKAHDYNWGAGAHHRYNRTFAESVIHLAEKNQKMDKEADLISFLARMCNYAQDNYDDIERTADRLYSTSYAVSCFLYQELELSSESNLLLDKLSSEKTYCVKSWERIISMLICDLRGEEYTGNTSLSWT